MTEEKKNLRVTACYYEISHNLDEALDALFDLGFLPDCTSKEETYESDAYSWIEEEPSEKDMRKFLKAMGY